MEHKCKGWPCEWCAALGVGAYAREEKGMKDENALTDDSNARKDIPMARGLLDYFPAALAEVARLSAEGNRKHNPGEELHHARGKSTDHADCILRHLTDRGLEDTDGFLHDVKVAWRALAMLQEAMEARGARIARGARLPEVGQLAPNNIDDRIAGDTDVARRIKDHYYTGARGPRQAVVVREPGKEGNGGK